MADEPIVSGMAGRYATALFELALEDESVDAIQADLASFSTLLQENPDLTRLVRSPAFSAAEQERALDAILKRARIEGTTARFLLLVAQKRRLFAVADMIRGFNELVARHKGEVRAEVTVAEQLSDKHLNEIRGALKSVAARNIILAVKIDPSILGGLKVKLGSRMIDASLKTKLNSIRLAMKEVR